MIFHSEYPDLDIPKVNVLDYLFPENTPVSDKPVWLDAANPDVSLSPKQLLQWVKRLCIGLGKLGLVDGDVCMIYSPNHIFIPVAYLGIVGSKCAFSAANPVYTVPEVVHQLRNTEAKCIIAHPSMVQNAIAAAKEVGLLVSRIFQFDDKPCATKYGVKDWREMLGSAADADEYRWKPLTPEESVSTVATINYSSGTTGLPKGVCVSHHNLIANVEQTIYMRWTRVGDTSKNERWIGFLPLYHAYGQLFINLIATKTKVPCYVMKQFVYDDFLQTIQRFKITHLQVAPPVLLMLNKRPETKNYDLSSVKSILCAAAPLARGLQNQVSRDMKVEIIQGWGMTELTCASILQPEPTTDGSIGKLMPNHECKLIDDDGNEVGLDTPGEMYIRSPNVCLSYFKNEPATKEAISRDRWLKTGDIAVVNKDGCFWIVDRKKELIKVNALQVAPAELEAVLLEHENIADAAVVGITIHGEEWPRAYVALKEGVDDSITPRSVQKWMKDRVAKHKHLVGGVRFVDEVPRLASGKIQRKLMREWAKRDTPEVERELASGGRARL